MIAAGSQKRLAKECCVSKVVKESDHWVRVDEHFDDHILSIGTTPDVWWSFHVHVATHALWQRWVTAEKIHKRVLET